MITYVNIKTGNRYPERGTASHFQEKDGKFKYFVTLGYPDCSQGWKKGGKKNWRREEIPDLQKPFTDAQFVEYAKQYGAICAQEFLDCCDYSKPRAAYQIINPPKYEWSEATELWFKSVFGQPLRAFADPYAFIFANAYSFDIIKFEKYLARQFGYPMHEDGSMKDFMVAKFGQEVTDYFQKYVLTTPQG